ncbi:MAG: conjugal transfer protein [Gemmatimonadota bacterium]|nr:conjugal transfer protein [Gemmatimonadota bacterium]MDH5615776.1 conjugal transfer protein [Acidimicrobiia bacterium]
MVGIDYHDSADVSVTCYSYTHARRFPLVIGKIGGFALPTPLSPSQLGTLLGSFFLMLASRRWWGVIVPGIGDALFLVVIPGTLTWAVRHLRMEGRSPVKMLFGVASLLLAPTQGTVRGRQVWTKARPERRFERIFIAGDTTNHAPVELRPQPKRSQALAQLRPTSPWACLDEEAA